MSDALAIDLFIQDFVNTNKLLNQHVGWDTLVNRRFAEEGRRKVFSFESGGSIQYATAQLMALPDSDWLRIDLTRAVPEVEDEGHRFDCLRMTMARTHTGLDVQKDECGALLVRLTTRHRGLMNLVFVIRVSGAITNPFLA